MDTPYSEIFIILTTTASFKWAKSDDLSTMFNNIQTPGSSISTLDQKSHISTDIHLQEQVVTITEETSEHAQT